MQRSWHQESLGLGFLAGGHRVKIRTPWSTGQAQASLCAPLRSPVLYLMPAAEPVRPARQFLFWAEVVTY